MYETFEHTADIGLRVLATDLNGLFAEAAEALFSVIVDNLDSVRPIQTHHFEISGTERDYLLFDWLNELLYVCNTRRLAFAEFDVVLTDRGLSAAARGEPLDLTRHRVAREVKAITYHQLKVERTDSGWLAEVVLDI